MAEDYVRPPLSGEESRSSRAGHWRFRLVFGLLIAALVVGLFFLVRSLIGGTGEGSPGVGNARASTPLASRQPA
jgi:hypothetical protein